MAKKVTTLRPREKLLKFGGQNLSDSELVSVILGHGTAQISAINLAKVISKKFPLSTWSELSPNQFLTIPGLGPAQSLKLLAAIELGQRTSQFREHFPTKLTAAQEVFDFLKPQLTSNREQLICIYLNARQEILSTETVALGHLNSLQLEPRDVLSSALKLPAAAIIMAHNHPSGNPSPSRDDLLATKKLQAAAHLLGIELLDHLIFGRQTFYSFKNEGRL